MVDLKKCKMTISELAELLDISRPTLYKMMELYARGEKLTIRHDVVLILDYISNNNITNKSDVYVYYNNLRKK